MPLHREDAAGHFDDRDQPDLAVHGAAEAGAVRRACSSRCRTCCTRCGRSWRPGLYKHEKRFAIPLVVSSIVLFYAGVAFAYFVVFPLMFAFLTTTAPTGVQVMTDISNYLDFVLLLFFAFGIAFEMPVATVLLAATGLVQRRDHDQEPRLRDSRHLRHRGVPHAARCAVADPSWPCRCGCCTKSASCCRGSCSGTACSAASEEQRTSRSDQDDIAGIASLAVVQVGVYTVHQLLAPARASSVRLRAPLQHPCH